MKAETEQIIIDMSKEFDDLEGYVTCEISIHRDTIPEMKAFVAKNTSIKLGDWVFMECETCVGYHGEGFVHASIERFESIEKMKKYSNFIY